MKNQSQEQVPLQENMLELRKLDQAIWNHTGDNSNDLYLKLQEQKKDQRGEGRDSEDNSIHRLQDRQDQPGRCFPDLDEPSDILVFDLSSEAGQPLSGKQQADSNPKRTQTKVKNSNSIKKIGRLILDHIKEFTMNGRENAGVRAMKASLNRSSKDFQSVGNKRDRFNLSHLSALLRVSDERVSEHNLRTTRKILCKHLRKQVLSSNQITSESKLIYLNTLKCSTLRCANSTLAVRLQMSEKAQK